MSIRVIEEKCKGCKLCVPACPFGAINVIEKLAQIDIDKCNLCGACVEACERFAAIELVRKDTPIIDKSQYKGVWVFAEQKAGKIANVTFELLSEGRTLADKLSQPLCAVLLGNQVAKAARDLVSFGAERVYLAQSGQLEAFVEDT